MTTVQKIIKYLALAFAMFIIVTIVSSILFGVYIFGSIIGLVKWEDEDYKPLVEMAIGTYNNSSIFDNGSNINNDNINDNNTNIINISDITVLKLDIGAVNLQIKKGDTLKVESNNEYISCKQNHNEFIIKEKTRTLFNINNKNNDLILYVPSDMIFDKVNLEAGAGKIEIESLKAKDLDFKLGAGKVTINELIVSNRAKIDGGAGKTEILSGEINNLDFELGIGENKINAKLTGKNELEAGVGSVKIRLTDGTENYTIKAEKGIGSITIDGKGVSDDVEYGNGDTYIKIHGGVGSIDIR